MHFGLVCWRPMACCACETPLRGSRSQLPATSSVARLQQHGTNATMQMNADMSDYCLARSMAFHPIPSYPRARSGKGQDGLPSAYASSSVPAPPSRYVHTATRGPLDVTLNQSQPTSEGGEKRPLPAQHKTRRRAEDATSVSTQHPRRSQCHGRATGETGTGTFSQTKNRLIGWYLQRGCTGRLDGRFTAQCQFGPDLGHKGFPGFAKTARSARLQYTNVTHECYKYTT